MNRALPLHGEIPTPSAPSGYAIGRKGFRPFFLLAALFACVAVPVWLLVLFGKLAPPPTFDAVTWHAHEMLFGYTAAVIAGFLLTAVGNWTGRETATGPLLFALAGVWGLGRVVMTLPLHLPAGAIAAVDLAFLPLLAVVLARPLVATGNRRNFVMLAVLGVLAAANVAVHLASDAVTAQRALVVALDVVVFLCVVIAGRIVPMFTRNATQAEGIVSSPALDRIAIVAMLGVLASDVVAPGSRAGVFVAGAAGVAVLARAARWGAQHTGRHPLLWILHAGHAWIAAGLLLRAAGAPPSLATHALTLGAIGALTLGMMARVALGHTGRPLAAARATTAAFACITVAAVARVAGPALWPAAYTTTLAVAGTAWVLAFALYLAGHVPILVAPRADGKAG
ncbi:MAG: NnrS family protein [Labilithrix sp.]|nr:NnrS family protein [Labilithrix sp.]MCW5812525.1 NnrS family protein [Labilithrix sp.]